MSREELRQKIIDAIKEKHPEDAHTAEETADFILSQPYINENTYQTFIESAGLL